MIVLFCIYYTHAQRISWFSLSVQYCRYRYLIAYRNQGGRACKMNDRKSHHSYDSQSYPHQTQGQKNGRSFV